MKVTALIPDELVQNVQSYAGGRNLTDCLIIALKEWVGIRELRKVSEQVRRKPFEFRTGFSADRIRTLNRK